MGYSSSAAVTRSRPLEPDHPGTLTGHWLPDSAPVEFEPQAIRKALLQCRHPIFILEQNGRLALARSGQAVFGQGRPPTAAAYPIRAFVPPLGPQHLGSSRFKQAHGLRYAYVAGAMANGITSVAMVAAMARAGMLGFFGAAGMTPAQVEDAIDTLRHKVPAHMPGFNFIHSPFDPQLEWALAELYLKHGVRRISASAYINLTLPLVYYRVKGVHRDDTGRVVCPHGIVAKVSRIEVARRFLSPPPPKMIAQLREKNFITVEEAALAAEIPMADDLTAEADSGGHTDNRPAITLLPTMLALRDQLHDTHNFARRPCVGLGGGIATPQAAAAAFAMGAAFVVVGTVHQSCIEAGTSESVRKLLAAARQGDVTMAPSADMFELGVNVQVLKRGTMFAQRAHKLYDLYDRHDTYEQIPARQRQMVERDILQADFARAWDQTQTFFKERDPRQITRAAADPKFKMALVFRSYLGLASKWAQAGDPQRQMDYQIWCGPAMGAFNQWVQNSFLNTPGQRTVTTVALNFLFGASVLTRAALLKNQGIQMPPDTDRFDPLPAGQIHEYLNL